MKILFSDLDGTLLEQGQIKTQKDRQALHRFQDQGNEVALCTGRTLFEVQEALRQGIPYDYLILNNGGEIYDHDHLLIRHVIKKETGLKLLNWFIKEPALHIYLTDQKAQYHYYQGQTCLYPEGTLINDLQQAYHDSSYFLIICIHQDQDDFSLTEKYMKEINSQYDDIVAYRNDIYLDIVPKGCSKASGISELIGMLKTTARTYGIGDSYNDIPMLEKCAISATFYNADTSVRKVATVSKYHYVYEFIDDILEEEI